MVTATLPEKQPKNPAKGPPTPGPTNRRSGHRPWVNPQLSAPSRQLTVDQHRLFRSSAVRSRIDRFPIFSSGASVYAYDYASRVSLESLLILGPVMRPQGSLGA
uniref:Uncharacterized protein n=1 Tax=Solanum tuberosum TaxID=4113 RepID=M1DBN3_SOLTU